MNLNNLLNGEITQEEFMSYYNTSIRYERLPKKINGFVFKYDSTNFVIIDKFLSEEKTKNTIIHELAHVELDHLYNYDKDLFAFNISKYEDEADKYIKFLGKEE